MNKSLNKQKKKYKIGENDIDNYEQGDIYLDKIEQETTVEEFINWNRIMYHNYNIENKTFLSVRFEDLVCDYDNTVSIIENYFYV